MLNLEKSPKQYLKKNKKIFSKSTDPYTNGSMNPLEFIATFDEVREQLQYNTKFEVSKYLINHFYEWLCIHCVDRMNGNRGDRTGIEKFDHALLSKIVIENLIDRAIDKIDDTFLFYPKQDASSVIEQFQHEMRMFSKSDESKKHRFSSIEYYKMALFAELSKFEIEYMQCCFPHLADTIHNNASRRVLNMYKYFDVFQD